jgi:glucose/sorbosone dehydrogenase
MASMRRLAPVLIALVLAVVGVPKAQAAPALVVVDDTLSSPIYVASPPGDEQRLFLVEQAGRIQLIKNGVKLGTPFLDIAGDVSTGSERGMFSVAFAPDYTTSGKFYVYYTDTDTDAGGSDEAGDLLIEEFRRSASDAERADVSTRRTVLNIPHPTCCHNGGQLQAGPDGLLWLATGDGDAATNAFNNAQNINSLLGKLLRIDPSGSPYTVPANNPFVGEPGADEVFASGLRNPWRFSFDRQTDDLVIADVGEHMWEEVNFAVAPGRGSGANYGWNCFEGAVVFTSCGLLLTDHTPPKFSYTHANGNCSITGGYVVRDPGLPTLVGRYIYGDWCVSQLRSVSLPAGNDDSPVGLSVPAFSLVSFGEDACGRVHVVSSSGTLYRLHDGAATPCGPALDGDDDGIPDETDLCPGEPGNPPSGCPPPPDGDGDGVPDSQDQCSDQPGDPPSGCPPPPDSDADGVPDSQDQCPNQPGNPPTGCPPAPPPPVDETPPLLDVGAGRRQRLLQRRGFRITASCSEACTLLLTGRLVVPRRGGMRRLSFRGKVSLEGGEKESFLLRVVRWKRRAVRGALDDGRNVRARVTLGASDAAGNDSPPELLKIRVVG